MAVAYALLISACTCAEARTSIPEYRAPRATEAPTIDGVLSDAIWSITPATETFVNTLTGDPAPPRSSARIAWDDDNLYVAFEVEDDWLYCDLSGHDQHLWEQDTVEIMVDPDSDGLNYFEMQLSVTEQVFDTRYASRRVPQPYGEVHWDSQLRGACSVDGTVNDDEEDGGYVAEMAIPWSAFTGHDPPSAGDEWRIALYVLDKRPDGSRGVGWSPPLVGDFHVPSRFGRVTFRE